MKHCREGSSFILHQRRTAPPLKDRRKAHSSQLLPLLPRSVVQYSRGKRGCWSTKTVVQLFSSDKFLFNLRKIVTIVTRKTSFIYSWLRITIDRRMGGHSLVRKLRKIELGMGMLGRNDERRKKRRGVVDEEDLCDKGEIRTSRIINNWQE